MRAQKVEDPSMEDILSSIRKIISEEGKDETSSASGNNSGAPNDEVSKGATRIANPQEPLPKQAGIPLKPQQSNTQIKPQQSNTQTQNQQKPDAAQRNSRSAGPGTQANTVEQPRASSQSSGVRQPPPLQHANPNKEADHSPQPSVFSERREYLDMDSIPRQEPRPTPGDQPPSPVEPVFAKKPNPMVRPAVHTQPGQSGSGGISEFVETKPPMDNNDSIAGKQRTDTEASLHPAIVNAKSHVSIQRSAKNSVAELAPEKNEIPVFESTPSSVDMPMEKLISPDNTDRRDVDERRSHPLRRGVDRAVSEVRKELMSPTTTDSVHTAFEQLKNMTLEGLDSNVREMIRPMLREWLDNNLPSMVERLVRDEIERVSRGE